MIFAFGGPIKEFQKSVAFETFFNKAIEQLGRGLWVSTFKVVNKSYTFTTKGEIDFIDLSDKVQEEVSDSGIKNGLVHIFAPHATGVLILTEKDEALLNDIKAFLEEIAPKDKSYQHPSNAHSHLRSVLIPPDKTMPIVNGQVTFGTWQSLLFVETDVYPRKRTIIIQVMGER
jgi:secondary thiamine-phosphate synthase enzyme